MYKTDQTRQPGQSWTLRVQKDPETGETIVSCPACPEVGQSKDKAQLFAIQDMRRKLDDFVVKGAPSTLILPGAEREYE